MSATVTIWIARLAWVAVAIFGGVAIESAVADRSTAVQWTAGIGGWTVWGTVTVMLLVSSIWSLTALRILAPLALGATLTVAVAGAAAVDIVAMGLSAIVACAAIFSADLGQRYAQSTAYGDEQRFPLRAPVGVGAAAVLTWFVWAACVIVGPLALAARNWVLGGILSAVAVAGLILVGPRWHRLSGRWLVYVPAGLVVRDPVVLADTFMLRSDQLRTIRLAPADTQAADLTGPASGYAVEVTTSESVGAVFAPTPQKPDGVAIHLTAFLVAPSRPGRALRAAADRRLPVA